MSGTIGSEIAQLIAFGALSFLMLRMARARGYFNELEPLGPLWAPPIAWYHVIGVFAIYFAFGILVMPMIMDALRPYLLKKVSENGQVSVMTSLNFLNTALVLLSVVGSSLHRFRLIWQRGDQKLSYLKDLWVALVTLVLAFPVIIFFSAFFDLLIYGIFQIENLPDQIAVQWLKMTFEFPLYFILTAITIVILAPVLEEILFRGYLQSFFRKYLGPKQAILLTSICFSLFHFSWGQGWSNIPIITSLFPLALFLGYIYEKQGSLFASISMHAIFNAISLVNIYFFGQFL